MKTVKSLLPIGIVALILGSVSCEDNVTGSPTEEAQKAQLEQTNWRDVHYSLFTTKKRHFHVDEVHDLIRQLFKIYKPFDDKVTNGRKMKIALLLSLSHIDFDSCSREQFQEYDDLMDQYSMYWHSIGVYLGHYRRKALDFCVDNYKELLKKNVEAVLGDQSTGKDKLSELTKTLVDLDMDDDDHHGSFVIQGKTMTQERIRKAVVDYVGSSIDVDDEDLQPTGFFSCFKHNKRSKKLKAKASEGLDTTVMNSCELWYEAVDPVVYLLSSGADLIFDRQEEIWVDNYILCNKLDRMSPLLRNELYDDLKNRGSFKEKVASHSLTKQIKHKLNFMKRYRERKLNEYFESRHGQAVQMKPLDADDAEKLGKSE